MIAPFEWNGLNKQTNLVAQRQILVVFMYPLPTAPAAPTRFAAVFGFAIVVDQMGKELLPHPR